MTAKDGQTAIANGRAVSRYESGMCHKYVRDQCWRVPSLYGSAIEAWNGSRDKHPGDRTPPDGAPLYFRGGQYGHTVIATTGDGMRSTDCHSTGNVDEDVISWTERVWGYEYLGWTGDCNGVDLPLGGEEEDMKPEDFDKIRAIVADEVEDAWQKQQSNGNGRSENLNTAGNVKKIVRDELDKALP